MTAPHIARRDLNHLRRGITYCATTNGGTTVGEYLGMESPHGDRAVLLRDESGTASISLDRIRSIRAVAA